MKTLLIGVMSVVTPRLIPDERSHHMKDNLQGGSTPKLTLNGVPLTEEITFHQFDAAWKELHRLWKAAQKSHSLTEVAELNGKLIERLLQIETTLEDALFWVEDCAVEMGFSLETGENLRP